MSICYIMPSLYPSGGNKMVVEHVKRLAARGHDTAVAVVSKHSADDAAWLEMEGVKVVAFDKVTLDSYSHVVATYWETYYYIKNLKLVGPEFHYFVQSKEEKFKREWRRKQQVISTLMDPTFHLFTEAKWIQEYFWDVFGRRSNLVQNHIEVPSDLDTTKRPRVKPIILIEGEATTSWKNISFGAKVSRQLRPEMDVWLLTNTPYAKINPFVLASFDKVISCVSWKEALETIAQADVLYRPSTLEGFNGAASEAMVLGTPCVLNKIPASYEAGIDKWNCSLVEIGKEYDAVDKIKYLLKEPAYREMIVANAKHTALDQFTNWDKSIDVLENQVFMEQV